MAKTKLPARVDGGARPESRKTSKVESEKPKLVVGMGSILAQSPRVADAFGRHLGFVLMMTAILAAACVSAASLFLLAKGLGRFI